MKISTKGRYALRMFIDLAEHDNEGYVSLKDICQRQDISKKYLEQIIALFAKTNILLTSRGASGGYKLAKPASEYTVGEILRLTEGSLAPVSCLDHDLGKCKHSVDCPTLPVWQGLNKVVCDYLDSITLQDIIEQRNRLDSDSYMI
ncbi:MAG: Rrf2 family transcriptional regulator [Acutalibacteraceae bacterium]|nr:Rrf2 family transcriptional regulator [Acutalibacteraceae bacterium]